MAYEQTTTKNIPLGERIGEGLKGAAEGIKAGIDLNETLKNNEASRNLAAQQLESSKQAFKEAQLKAHETAVNQQANLMFNTLEAGLVKNPDNSYSWDNKKLDASANIFYSRQVPYSQFSGNVQTQEQYAQNVKDLANVLGPQNASMINHGYTTLSDVNTPPDAHKKLAVNLSDALNSLRLVNPDLADVKQKQFDDAEKQYQENQVKLKSREMTYNYKAQKTSEDFDKEGRKALIDAEKVISGVGSRGGQSPLAKMSQRAFGGRLLDNMLDAVSNPNLPESQKIIPTKQVAMTFARNFDSTIAQGGSSAEFAQHLVPDSYQGKAAEFWQKVKADPQKYLTDEFLLNFANEIKVERDSVSQDIGQMVSSQYNSLKQTYGQDKADKFLKTAQERYKKDSFVSKMLNSVDLGSANNASTDDHQGAAEWLNDPKNKSDPNYPAVLKKFQASQGQ